MVLLFVGLKLSGATELLGADRLRDWVSSAGVWGAPVYVGIFVAGVVMQIPGLLFVGAAPLLFPPIPGFLLCVVAANLAVNANFAVVRRLGGATTDPPEGSLLARGFARLTTHPVRAVAIIRLAAVMFPPVTATLALTPVRFRDHAVGSFIGLLAPLAIFLGAVGAVMD
jgi:uncharacterized membrane protein YdjX (TVP38/TMEM64 family)